MTLKEFFAVNKLSMKDITFKESPSTYKDAEGKDTGEIIQYWRLSKPVEGFNFMTLSLNAVKAFRDNPKAGKDLEVSLTDDYGWKIQVADSNPNSHMKFDLEDLFQD